MITLYNWFVKITGYFVQLFMFKNKIYYEDKSLQSRRIKGSAIIVSNHVTVMDFAVMMFVFYTRTLRCLIAELMFSSNIFLTNEATLRTSKRFMHGNPMHKLW